jgi:2',3'-cyclic-nucleotide 2'-phosphodiesterase (5'-nucleotidase family)
MSTRIAKFAIVVVILALIVPTSVSGQGAAVVQVTLLHTNDFHGRLETDYKGRGGSAYLASVVNDIRAAAGEENVALLDGGDVYFAAPAISQLLMGESAIDIYNMMGYDLAAFGNHEFDKGQEELAARVAQSDFPWLGRPGRDGMGPPGLGAGL